MKTRLEMSNNLKNRNRQTISRISKGAAIIVAALCFFYVSQSDEPEEKRKPQQLKVKVVSSNDAFTASAFQGSTEAQLADLNTKIQRVEEKKQQTQSEKENLSIWQAQARIYHQVQDLEMRVNLHKEDPQFDAPFYEKKILRLMTEARQIQNASE
ncbi:MAG: hypothetical protein AAFS00_07185 [Bacteroidota bacterium]